MNWKKVVTLGMAALTLVAFTAGCGSDTNKADTQTLPKKIVIGLDDNYPPMGFRDEKGNLVGFDIDMAKEAAKRAGMEVEFKPIDWDSKEAELKSKHIDVLWNGLTVTEERKQNMAFTKPYLKDKQIIVVRKDSPINSKEQLEGKIVGTQQGSTGETVMEKDPFTKKIKEVKKYGDYVNAFMDLKLGRIDAMVVDGIVGNYTMSKEPGEFRAVTGSDYGSEDNAIGLRKEDTALREKLNSILGDMMKDGTADKLAEKWFGTSSLLDKDAYK